VTQPGAGALRGSRDPVIVMLRACSTALWQPPVFALHLARAPLCLRDAIARRRCLEHA
jgi:hypothetical protein